MLVVSRCRPCQSLFELCCVLPRFERCVALVCVLRSAVTPFGPGPCSPAHVVAYCAQFLIELENDEEDSSSESIRLLV
jgi:hypothetical protein